MCIISECYSCFLNGKSHFSEMKTCTFCSCVCVRVCFCRGMVEYDAEGFTKLTLLLMWKDFCFLVHGSRGPEHTHTHTSGQVRTSNHPGSALLLLLVDLPLYFPRDQPTLTFQSVYHFTNSGQLYSQVQKSYPYSPRWDGNEMAKRAK